MWRVDKTTIGLSVGLLVVITAFSVYDVKEMTDQSQRNYLRLYGDSIYEYHALTGKWPSKIDDLAQTSLPVKYPNWWKVQLDTEADVIVWPKNLKPDPNDNGHIILCYHNKGLDAERGRMWVCWGDLRTGWITLEELQERLNKPKQVETVVDPKVVGVWQNQNDAREIWTVRADGSLQWFYRGVPAIGILDSIVEYTYRADPTQSPAHLDVIHRGIMGTSFCIYEVADDVLRIGIAPDKAGNWPKAFGPMDKYYKRVCGPVTENPR